MASHHGFSRLLFRIQNSPFCALNGSPIPADAPDKIKILPETDTLVPAVHAFPANPSAYIDNLITKDRKNFIFCLKMVRGRPVPPKVKKMQRRRGDAYGLWHSGIAPFNSSKSPISVAPPLARRTFFVQHARVTGLDKRLINSIDTPGRFKNNPSARCQTCTRKGPNRHGKRPEHEPNKS